MLRKILRNCNSFLCCYLLYYKSQNISIKITANSLIFVCTYGKIKELKRGADEQEYPIGKIVRDFGENRRKGIAAEAFGNRYAVRWE